MSELAQAMVLTDRAAAKVRKLREGEANPELKLRVYITGGGCSGFSYGFITENGRVYTSINQIIK